MSHEDVCASAGRETTARLPLLREVSWPDEQVAFHRAALGLIDGEPSPLEPTTERLRELLCMAGDLGLVMAHAPETAGGPGHGLAASLLATEAFATSPGWSSIFEAAVGCGVDPLLLLYRGSDEERALLRSLGLGEALASGPRLHGGAFASLRIESVWSGEVLLETDFITPERSASPGARSPAPDTFGAADILVVPAHSASGDRLVCFVPHRKKSGALGPEETAHPPPARPLVLPVSDEALLALALMRRLRSAFARLGSTQTLLDRASRLLLERPTGTNRPAGGVRGRLASAVARLDIARLLAHNSGHLVDRAYSRANAPAAALQAALIDQRLLVDLCDLGSWYALRAAAALIQEAFAGSTEAPCRMLCRDAMAHHALAAGARAEETLDAANSLSTSSGTELPSLGLPAGTGSIDFRESPLAAASQQTASMALSLAVTASPDAQASSCRESLALPLLAIGLELEASTAEESLPLELPPSALPALRDSSKGALLSLETAKSAFSKTADDPSLTAAISDLERLWRHGPFRRTLADELSIHSADLRESPPPRLAAFDTFVSGTISLDDPSTRNELLLRAGEAGLLWPQESLPPSQRAEWLTGSLFATESFSRKAALQGFLGSFAIQALDPLLVLGEHLPAELRESLSTGRLRVSETPIWEGIFESARARVTKDGSYLLDGEIAEVAHVAAADLLLIPTSLPSGERLVHLVSTGADGVSLRPLGLDRTGAPIHAVELTNVRATATSTMPVSDESLETLLILRSLRDSFDLLGRARAIRDAIAAESTEQWQDGLHDDLAILEARLESARRLAHSAAATIGAAISAGSAGGFSKNLCLALGDRFTLIGLAKTAAWYACSKALLVDAALPASNEQTTAGDRPSFAAMRDAMASSDEKDSFAIANDLPEELATGIEPALDPPSEFLCETPGATAAHLVAALAFHAAGQTEPVPEEDLALLASAGTALDLWASFGLSLEPGAQHRRTGLGFLSVQEVLAAGRRVLDTTTTEEARRAAARQLDAIETKHWAVRFGSSP